MNKYYLSFLLFFQFSFVCAQELCTTRTEMSSATKELFADGSETRSTTKYLIRIYFHVIRKTDGSGANIVQNNVQTAYNILNTDFNLHGIYFVWDHAIDYINSDSYYNDPGSNIFSVNNHSDGVDIYLYGDNVWEGGLTYDFCNNTGFYIGGRIWLYPSLFLAGTHVVSHEMGHVLGLYHTHHGTSPDETSGCKELVNGSNADVCGDEVEDTPADPGLNNNVNPNTGQWLGYGLTDANGDYYLPDTHLIMSYTHPSCMSYFSTMQAQRMRNAISHSPSLQNTILSVGQTIMGPQLINTCSHYQIDYLPSGLTVSWSLSDSYYNNGYNLLIPNYPTTGHCLIVRDQNHDLIDATLTAKIKCNGVIIDSLKKTGLYAYDGFRGHYTSAVGSGDINGASPFYVKPNWTYYITSPNFYGATVTYDSSGATPSIWGFSPTYGDLTFVTTNTYVPVLINVDDVCGNHYQLVALLDNTPATSFFVSYGESGITVTLNGDEASDRGLSQDQSWTVEVRSATTGQLMATQSSTSRSETISTAGWPKGIYIVKVTVGKEVLTEKVVVK